METNKQDANIDIDKIKKIIPNICFEKSLTKSLLYMFFDIALLSTAPFIFTKLHYGMIILYWFIYGFFAWSTFVIGHDCGHGSFSNYQIINSICGNICHSIVLVPYYPWKRSHYFHHLYHNHKDKDKSHPWMRQEKFKSYPKIIQILNSSFISPFISFWIYLYLGKPDGSHLIWFGKLYNNTNKTEKIKGFISILCVFVWLYFTFFMCDYSFILWYNMYGGIITFCHFWLFMVTYFQHHTYNTKVYLNKWTFFKGALETIDRKIGYGIDNLHHNISDCHVIHHLFFRDIPHYNLSLATKTLRNSEYNKYFKFEDHSKFPLKYIYDFFVVYLNIGHIKWKMNDD
jgi:omega-3 fatty acid desaturase (delta-15 desaturase)